MLYLDTEFNGHGGELISLALASTTGRHFYGVVMPRKPIDPWVAEHVMPILGMPPESSDEFKRRLWEYMLDHATEVIFADWPEDFALLCLWLTKPGGIAPRLELTMRLIVSGEIKPQIPHNALSDAVALMEWHRRAA